MPVRVNAKSPGEFMRDHLVDAGGIDYPQAIFRAYKAHLKSQGLKNLPSRATMSTYIWRARQVGLIVFDHPEPPAYWDAIEDGTEVPANYVPGTQPLAPSPRHYYRILDPNDPRWIKLEASYREEKGLPIGESVVTVTKPPQPEVTAPPPPAPRRRAEVTPRVPEEEAPVPKTRRPRAAAPSPVPAAREAVAPLDARRQEILAKLDILENSPSIPAVADFENELLELGEDIIDAAEGATGLERTLLSNLNSSVIKTLDRIGLLRTSVQRRLVSRTQGEIGRADAALRAAIRVAQEDLSTGIEEGGT